MIQLVVYLVMAVAAIATIGGIIHSHDNGVRAKEAAVWKPQLEAAQADTKTATDANLTLQGNLKKLDQERQLCSAGVKAQGDAHVAAEKVKAAALVAAGSKIATLEQDRVNAEAKLALTAIKAETCDEQLAKIDADLGELGARRLRDYPPTGGSGQSGKPAAGPGPGPGSLRISH